MGKVLCASSKVMTGVDFVQVHNVPFTTSNSTTSPPTLSTLCW